MYRAIAVSIVLFAIGCFMAREAAAQTTEFAYQGFLKDGANAANGNYDFEFRLFDSPTGGTQIGITLQRLSVPVVQGSFTVSLDFGSAAFTGPDRLIGIDVRPTGGGAFTPLGPRQKVNSAPYSVRSLNSASAEHATNAAQLGGVAAGQYVITTDPRMSDARNPLANSPNYIQNSVAQQAGSNFNISGNGTAAIINALTQFNIGGSRILGNPGTNNLYAGVGAGLNSIGINNAFFGASAGSFTTTTSGNSFFGSRAGQNQMGGSNSFFGERSGQNSTGNDNSFFGAASGLSNFTGERNTFAGSQSGRNNQTGVDNVFVGTDAGISNLSGSSNTIIGSSANLSNGLTNAGAFGFRASVTQSNSITLGSINGVNGATADTNVGIGTTAPARRLHVSSGSSGASSLSTSDLVVEDNAAAFQHFLTPDNIESGILFGDPTDNIGGGIVFNNVVTNNGMMFRSGGNTTRMVLDGAGNLGLGILAPQDKLDVIGSIRVSALGAPGLTHLCRNASSQISTCVNPRPEPDREMLTGLAGELRAEIDALQKTNADQQKQIDEQREQIRTLILAVCLLNKDLGVCPR